MAVLGMTHTMIHAGLSYVFLANAQMGEATFSAQNGIFTYSAKTTFQNGLSSCSI